MSDLSMLINGLKVTAEKNATFGRRNPLDGSIAALKRRAADLGFAITPTTAAA